MLTNEQLIHEIKCGRNVKSNMYLLYSQNITLLKRWSKGYINSFGADDVLQECYIALHKAVQTFDFKKEYKFTTYLQKVVKTQLSEKLCGFTGFNLNQNDKALLMQYNSLCESRKNATGKDISDFSACRQLHCTENQLKRIRQYKRLNNCLYLDSPIKDNNGDDISILNILPDKYNTEMDYEQQDIKRYALKIWDYVHSICNENEEKVLKLRFKEALTRAKIGEICGISIERTRQIEQQGFKRLRYNSEFRKWAKDFDYVCDLSYHYGFSSWLYNQQSAVELAVEIKDREYSRLQKEAKISNEAIQEVINALLN